MRVILLLGVSSLLLGTPAMSATPTYFLDGWATGLANDDESATPGSISGGASGATFSGSATNADGGSVSAFASEGIGDVSDYNAAGDAGIDGRSTADIKYTIRVSGPTTGALVPVHIRATVSTTSLTAPAPVGGVDGYYAPVTAGADAQVTVAYAEGDVPIGAPDLLAFAQTFTSYDYRHFSDPDFAAPVVLGSTKTLDEEVMVEANFDVAVNVVADAGAEFMGSAASYPETAEGGASADPTFVIDEPGYSAYTLEGVLADSTTPPPVAAPEPATWAMMLVGFARLSFAGYRARQRGVAAI